MGVNYSRIPAIDTLQKSLENIISLTGTISATTTLSNGQGVTFTVTTESVSGNQTFVIPDWSVYIGSVDVANILPNGSGINMTQWIITPFVNNWGDTNNFNTVFDIYIQNVSAGANKTVIIETQSRVINNSTTLGGST